MLPLQEAASQFLLISSTPENVNISEKIELLIQRIQLLKVLCDAYIVKLSLILEAEDDNETVNVWIFSVGCGINLLKLFLILYNVFPFSFTETKN